jgi:hypothetical protein
MFWVLELRLVRKKKSSRAEGLGLRSWALTDTCMRQALLIPVDRCVYVRSVRIDRLHTKSPERENIFGALSQAQINQEVAATRFFENLFSGSKKSAPRIEKRDDCERGRAF